MRSDVQDLLVFLEVVRAGSFAGAARALDLPPSSVSRRVARLEEQVGRKLLHRTTRRMSLTDAGRLYHDRVARVPADIAEAERAVAALSDTPGGLIRMTAPSADVSYLWPVLEAFLREAPAVRLSLMLTAEPVDLLAHGIDVALRGGRLPDSAEYTARHLVDERFWLGASAAYLEARGVPRSVAELDEHDLILCDGTPPWPGGAPRRPRLRFDRPDYARAAARSGFGITLMIGPDEELVEVLPEASSSGPLWAVYPVRHANAAIRALVEHLERAFAAR
jgi:DNA-binding transcriptional LysR family regulator